jgi:hypothetical protein
MDTIGLDDFDDLLEELPTAGIRARLVLYRNHRPIGQPLGRQQDDPPTSVAARRTTSIDATSLQSLPTRVKFRWYSLAAAGPHNWRRIRVRLYAIAHA